MAKNVDYDETIRRINQPTTDLFGRVHADRRLIIGVFFGVVAMFAQSVYGTFSTRQLITSYHRQTAATLTVDHSATAQQLATYNKELTQARQDLGASERTDTALRAQVSTLEAEVKALGGKPKVVMVPEPVIVTKPLPPPAPAPTTTPSTTTTTTIRPRPPPRPPTTPPTTSPCMVTFPSTPYITIPGVPPGTCLAAGEQPS